VKELALYVRDVITKGNWSLNIGLRGDLYNGLTVARQAEPRVGVAYNIKKTNTILRVSYARTLESPFNENLILSSDRMQQCCLYLRFWSVRPEQAEH
jgi:outer membrane receptor protein involved in Fe transport